MARRNQVVRHGTRVKNEVHGTRRNARRRRGEMAGENARFGHTGIVKKR